ncbi:MAG TPA: threonine/serine dehydratase [Pyrinomonadaceae bacterium]|nr:threonine/serine dehydratase [Pyrinomonadaceae bacterium]
MQASSEVTRERIRATEHVIRPHIRQTPILEVDGEEFGLDPIKLVFKLELFQHSGSFKARGAFTNMLTREVPAAGVVAASGGNHGAAVAFAAMKLGKPATIFVPSVASPAKLDRIRRYGAELVITGDRYAESLEASHAWTAQSGALPIHAYEGTETLLGQGTLGMELEQQDPKLDSLLIAVGGGGLIGGVAGWYQNRIRMVAVEPFEAPTLERALSAGHPVDAPAGGVAADSLAPRQVGKQMFPIAQQYVKEVVLVTDDEIIEAQKRLWESVRVLAEPGGAAAFAALLSGRYKSQPGERVGVVVCGGNTDKVHLESS